MSTLATRKLPQLRHRWLTVLVAAAVLLAAASLGSAVSAPSASAQGWPWNYGSGYGGLGYGLGYGGYGGLGYGGYGGLGYGLGYGGYGSYGLGYAGYGYPFGFALSNNAVYLPSTSCTNSVYCGSAYNFGYGSYSPYSSSYYGGWPYSSYPYSSYSPLYSGYGSIGNSLYSYQPISYATAAVPTTTVSVTGQPYAATYVSTGGNYCNLPNGGMAWIPAGASPASYGC